MQPDKVAGSPGNPQTFNRYAYAGSDPINGSDATGLDWFSDWISPASQDNFGNGAAFANWIIGQEDMAFFGYQYWDLPGNENDIAQEEYRNQVLMDTGYDVALQIDRSPCSPKDYEDLSTETQDELTLMNVSAGQWNDLSDDQRLGFFNVTGAMLNAGLSTVGLTVDWGNPDAGGAEGPIHQDRVFFTGASNTYGEMEISGIFSTDIGAGGGHPGYNDSYRLDVPFYAGSQRTRGGHRYRQPESPRWLWYRIGCPRI